MILHDLNHTPAGKSQLVKTYNQLAFSFKSVFYSSISPYSPILQLPH